MVEKARALTFQLRNNINARLPREFRSSGDVGRNRRKKLRGQIFRTGRRDARHRQNFCRLIFFTVFLFPSRHLLQQLLLLPLARVSVVARTGERRVVVTFWFSALTTKKNLFYSELLITQCPNASADLKKMNKATIRWRKNSVFLHFYKPFEVLRFNFGGLKKWFPVELIRSE